MEHFANIGLAPNFTNCQPSKPFVDLVAKKHEKIRRKRQLAPSEKQCFGQVMNQMMALVSKRSLILISPDIGSVFSDAGTVPELSVYSQ